MNVFDIIFSSRRHIEEEHVSAVLGWLLDPTQSHGAGSVFLDRLLRRLDPSHAVFADWITQQSHLVAYREHKDSAVEVVMERPVSTEADKQRDIDIVLNLLRVDARHQVELAHIVAIENKIRDSAVDRDQLADEYNGLRAEAPEIPIWVLYITPSLTAAAQGCVGRLPQGVHIVHLTWTGEGSVAEMLLEILRDELDGAIAPMASELKLLLRSYIAYARNGFRSRTAVLHAGGRPQPRNYSAKVRGLAELRLLRASNPTAFVGYTGGIEALQKAVADEAEREYMQTTRLYKWVETLDQRHRTRNWIPIGRFLDGFDALIAPPAEAHDRPPSVPIAPSP